MIVLSPFAKGNNYAGSIMYDHSSTLRTMEEIFSVSRSSVAPPTRRI